MRRSLHGSGTDHDPDDRRRRDDASAATPHPGKRTRTDGLIRRAQPGSGPGPVPTPATPTREPATPAVAQRGLTGSPRPVPHRDALEASFGADLGAISAYTDDGARDTAASMGARAYSYGRNVAFAETTPSQATVAHEVSHSFGHGERVATEVAHAVSSGAPASAVLARHTPAAPSAGAEVQLLAEPDAPAVTGSADPPAGASETAAPPAGPEVGDLSDAHQAFAAQMDQVCAEIERVRDGLYEESIRVMETVNPVGDLVDAVPGFVVGGGRDQLAQVRSLFDDVRGLLAELRATYQEVGATPQEEEARWDRSAELAGLALNQLDRIGAQLEYISALAGYQASVWVGRLRVVRSVCSNLLKVLAPSPTIAVVLAGVMSTADEVGEVVAGEPLRPVQRVAQVAWDTAMAYAGKKVDGWISSSIAGGADDMALSVGETLAVELGINLPVNLAMNTLETLGNEIIDPSRDLGAAMQRLGMSMSSMPGGVLESVLRAALEGDGVASGDPLVVLVRTVVRVGNDAATGRFGSGDAPAEPEAPDAAGVRQEAIFGLLAHLGSFQPDDACWESAWLGTLRARLDDLGSDERDLLRASASYADMVAATLEGIHASAPEAHQLLRRALRELDSDGLRGGETGPLTAPASSFPAPPTTPQRDVYGRPLDPTQQYETTPSGLRSTRSRGPRE